MISFIFLVSIHSFLFYAYFLKAKSHAHSTTTRQPMDMKPHTPSYSIPSPPLKNDVLTLDYDGQLNEKVYSRFILTYHSQYGQFKFLSLLFTCIVS